VSDGSRLARRILRRVTIILVLAVLMLALVWAGQRRLIYLPFGDPPSPAIVGLPDAQPVTFATADGLTLRGWFVPAGPRSAGLRSAGVNSRPTASEFSSPWPLGPGPRPPVTVLVFNGNAGHRGFRAPLAAGLRERGYASFLFDYRGYGGNPGSPSEAGLSLDARAARDYLVGRNDVAADRLVYFGESLGAAVAIGLAAEHPPLGLILRSPFTSLAEIGRHHYPILPVRLLLRDRYPSIDRIAQVGCPLLVIAGERDSIIPAAQSERLYAAAVEPKRFVTIEGADHNDYALLAGPRMLGAIAEFLEGLERRP
jgi:fermentation-respiration switch protein FrsA (DUF1100 family)